MKNAAIINTCNYGSTGKIAISLLNLLKEKGVNAVFFYGRGEKDEREDTILFESKPEVYFHALLSRVFGSQGSGSRRATRRMIRRLCDLQVDTVYCLNLHGYYLCEDMFWKYLSDAGIAVVYVMPDEYPYLGKCTNVTDCRRYETGCGKCPHVREYPASLFFDRSRDVFNRKMLRYSSVEKCVFVGPAYCVNNAKKSPLMEKRRLVELDEAIDTDVFRPRDPSALRRSLGITDDKTVVVCIAPTSNESKGCRYFLELARRAVDDPRFVFVQVAYAGNYSELPSNYITEGYVRDQNRLAEYYSLADIFVFPSLVDTMPNACLESLACGTPLLCFDVSGMPFVMDDSVGRLVDIGDVDAMYGVLCETPVKDEKTIRQCREYALRRFDGRSYFDKLYRIGTEFSID